VDSCWVLDVNDLSKRGCLQPGLFSTYRWHDGIGGIFSIHQRYEAESGVGRLYLSWRNSFIPGDGTGAGGDGEQGREREEVTEVVPIVRSPCRFGGSQPFFLCPSISGGERGGVICGRRVSKLFLAQPIYGRRQGYFLCRQCSGVVYASKYEKQPWQRAARRASKLRQRLGITGLSVPNKPYGMLVADYERLLEETLQAEIKATEAGTARLLHLATGIGSRRRKSPQFTL
jgi:hypothetical protein